MSKLSHFSNRSVLFEVTGLLLQSNCSFLDMMKRLIKILSCSVLATRATKRICKTQNTVYDIIVVTVFNNRVTLILILYKFFSGEIYVLTL